MGQGCNKLFCLYRRLLFYDVTTNFFYPCDVLDKLKV